MREDMMKKKREKMMKGEGANDFKVEIVGLPDFMQPSASSSANEDHHDLQHMQRPSSNLKELKQKYKIEKSQS